MNFALDLNTLLSSGILALTIWTLKTVVALDRKQAAADEKHAAIVARTGDHHDRISRVESKVGTLEVGVAKLQARE